MDNFLKAQLQSGQTAWLYFGRTMLKTALESEFATKPILTRVKGIPISTLKGDLWVWKITNPNIPRATQKKPPIKPLDRYQSAVAM